MHSGRTPSDLREGVRHGILSSLLRDADRKGGPTAQRLVIAGASGASGAVGLVLLLGGHPFGHHPAWHVAAFSAGWTALLVVGIAMVLLDVRTPDLPLSQAASVGIVGLGLAGLCGWLCPDPHFLDWWRATRAGAAVARTAGPALSALCFGLVATFVLGVASALLAPVEAGMRARSLAGGAFVALLFPGIVLQAFDESSGVLLTWFLGTAVGAWCGVAGGLWLRGSLRRAA